MPNRDDMRDSPYSARSFEEPAAQVSSNVYHGEDCLTALPEIEPRMSGTPSSTEMTGSVFLCQPWLAICRGPRITPDFLADGASKAYCQATALGYRAGMGARAGKPAGGLYPGCKFVLADVRSAASARTEQRGR